MVTTTNTDKALRDQETKPAETGRRLQVRLEKQFVRGLTDGAPDVEKYLEKNSG